MLTTTTCAHCGKDFGIQHWVLNRSKALGYNTFCNLACSKIGRVGKQYTNEIISKRFWSKVKKGDGCWEWQASRSPRNYGEFKYKGVRRLAHRVAYELVIEVSPNGMVVMHTCDNPPCVNPAHLRLGTLAENVEDRERKGRGSKGQAHSEKMVAMWARKRNHYNSQP